VLDTFFDDAFTTLDGRRPDFNALQAGSEPRPGGGGGSAPLPGGGFAWSTLVSEETLTDEIKDTKAALAKAIATPSTFKGGGYNEARVGFGTVAMSFGVIAAYDKDIRWKKQAEQARDLFARVGSNCKVGTDQSLAESKARVADLEALLEGNPIQAKVDREEDFVWSQVAGRPSLMSRLEEADARLAAAIASKGDFSKQADVALHEAELVALIGEVIQQKDYEYHDDDTYRGYASAMRDAAVKARDAATKNDYEAARAAVGAMQKSCNDCHGGYRG